MGEIISLQLGQCGNSVGCNFWKSISNEHGLEATGTYSGQNDLQLEKINVYFNELRRRKYVPRTVFVDLNLETREYVVQSPYRRIFRPENVVVGPTNGQSIWAAGYYTDGFELSEPVLEVVRREAEKTDCLQGFQLTHNPGAATGGGLTSLLLWRLQEDYPSRVLSTFTITPGYEPEHVTVLRPYNFVLSMPALIDNCDVSFMIDNQAAYNVALRRFNLSAPQFSDLNSIISQVITGVTSFVRFPSSNSLNSNLRRLCGNMVPFNRLHFLETGFAPFTANSVKRDTPTLLELSEAIFNRTNSMSAYLSKTPEEFYLALSVLLHGDVPFHEAQTQVHQARLASPYHRQAPWISEDTQVGQSSSTNSNRHYMEATLLGNTTAIRGTFEHVYADYEMMYRKRAFMCWYTQEGLDELEFHEANQALLDLVARYKEMVDDATRVSEAAENEERVE
ncbi:tubulin beta chain [Flagelloscypha sp. PMI_526]|nr:tubulin beta chain [Flagelloscypha sp. PMI_526]